MNLPYPVSTYDSKDTVKTKSKNRSTYHALSTYRALSTYEVPGRF